jgi:hypothetical protein
MTLFKLTPDAAYLRECFAYDAATGVLTWLPRPMSHFTTADACTDFNRRWATRAAGTTATQKYGSARKLVKINCVSHQYARIVWAHQTGECAFGVIDHIDGDATNNKWCNLREVTVVQNGQNRKHTSNTLGGVTGVNLCRKTNKWRAGVTFNKKYVWLGQYDKHDDAVAKVMAFKRDNFKSFMRVA